MVPLLLIACFLLCALLGVVLAVSIQAFRAYASIRDSFIGFVSSPGKSSDGNPLPSPMAETIDLAGQSVAARLSQQLLASFNGQASGMARGLKTVEADIAQATIANTGNPLAMIAGALFEKQLRKNPMLAMGLSQLKFGQREADAVPKNGHSSQIKLGF